MQAIASAELAPRVTHDRILVIFGGLLLVMLLAALDSTIVATALPTIVNELGGLAHLSWVVTAYLLAQTIVTPIYGKLGDLYGRKRILQFAIILFLIGSALCGLSQSMTHLILFRAIQGFGGGGLMVTTQAIVGDIIPPRQRGRYQGIFGAAFGVGFVLGPALGGLLGNSNPRLPFWVAGGLSLANALYGFLVLPESLPAEKRQALGISDGLVRISAGLEDIEDLKEDLAQALECV